MIAIGDNISKLYLGNTEVGSAYLGDTLVYSSSVGIDWIELRVDTSIPVQRVFTSSDINGVDAWANGGTPFAASWKDVSGNGNDAIAEVSMYQPIYNSSNRSLLFNGANKLEMDSGLIMSPGSSISIKLNLKEITETSYFLAPKTHDGGVRYNGETLLFFDGINVNTVNYTEDPLLDFTTVTINRENDGNLSWYCDNVYIGQTVLTTTLTIDLIGNRADDRFAFDDAIYAVMMNTSILSTQEISDFYNSNYDNISNIHSLLRLE